MKLQLQDALSFIDQHTYEKTFQDVKKAHQALLNKTIKGHEFLGWVGVDAVDEATLKQLQATAKRLQDAIDVLVVVGIGGSYLGAQAALDALSPYFNHTGVNVIFAGHHMSGAYMSELLTYLDDQRYAINVISKSGTTTEPALAFRLLKQHLEARLGEKAKDYIIATTDAHKGALRTLADEQGYETYVVPDDIGGRYSVFSAVGLLPMAVAGIDIEAFLKGAKAGYEAYKVPGEDNPAMQYATTRQSLYRLGKKIEMFVHYEPKLHFTAEWWKQLYGESEGKDGQGIFVSSAGFSTDLHSLGQMIQEGEKIFFETVLSIETPLSDLTIPKDEANLDGLNYLAGETLDAVNGKAQIATRLAHVDGDVPNLVISLPTLDAYYYGQLLYFYCFACAISGAASGVNPFDQPGVEAYKVNMFALLGKPGFEEETAKIKARLKK